MNRQNGAVRSLHYPLCGATESDGIEGAMTAGTEEHQIGVEPLGFSDNDLGRLADRHRPGGGDPPLPGLPGHAIEMLSGGILQLHRYLGMELGEVRCPACDIQGVHEVEREAPPARDLKSPADSCVGGLGEIGSGNHRATRARLGIGTIHGSSGVQGSGFPLEVFLPDIVMAEPGLCKVCWRGPGREEEERALHNKEDPLSRLPGRRGREARLGFRSVRTAARIGSCTAMRTVPLAARAKRLSCRPKGLELLELVGREDRCQLIVQLGSKASHGL